MQRLRIGSRIYIIVGILLVTGVVSMLIAYQGMNEIRTTYDRAFTDRAPVTRVLENIRSTLPDVNMQIWTMLVRDMPKDFISQQASDTIAGEKAMQGYVADWERNAVKGASPAEEAKFKELVAAMQPWLVAIDEYSDHMQKWAVTGDEAERQVAFTSNDSGAVDTTTKDLQAVLEELHTINEKENAKARAEAQAEQASAMRNLALVIGLITIIGIATGVAISRSITRPLKAAVRFADAVAGGDMTAKIGAHPGGETGDLTKAVESMKESLVKRVDQMHEVAAVVEIAAEGVTGTAYEVIRQAKDSGNTDLAEKGESLSTQAGNLMKALSAFRGGDEQEREETGAAA